MAKSADTKEARFTEAKVAAHASEGGHWYDRHGNQVVEVPSAKGDRMLKTTLREARKHDLAPGVTTIIRQAHAPMLETWKINQGILAALTLPRLDDEPEDKWLARVHLDRQEAAKAAAEEGTRIHAAIESAINGDDFAPAYEAHVDNVARILDGLSGNWLIDFKGTDKPAAKLSTYDSHWMQLSATRQALANFGAETGGAWMSEVNCASRYGFGTKADLVRISDLEDTPRCGICYVNRETADALLLDVTEDKLFRGWDMFLGLLYFWQAKNAYRPTWADRGVL